MFADFPPPIPGVHWYKVEEYARLVGRSPRTVRKWAQIGFLSRGGLRTYRNARARGHWFIGVSNGKAS